MSSEPDKKTSSKKEEKNSTNSNKILAKKLMEVYFNFTEVIPESVSFIKTQKLTGKKIYYLSNISQKTLENFKDLEIMKWFDGGIAGFDTDYKKPDRKIFETLQEKYNISDPKSIVYFDDLQENLNSAKDLGWGTVLVNFPEKGLDFKVVKNSNPRTNLDKELAKAEDRKYSIPKVLFLGKPNVGKSSLFNAMIGKEIQIITDIAGTTLSVNDTEIEREIVEEIDILELKRSFKKVSKAESDSQPIKILEEELEEEVEEIMEDMENIELAEEGVEIESLEELENLEEAEELEDSKIQESLNQNVESQDSEEELEEDLDLEEETLETLNLDFLEEEVIQIPRKQKYILLDSAGIRKPSQRVLGAESFATFKTIQAAYESDVICLVVDGSEPLTHQDQLVAGIAKQARKGLIVVVNKLDLVDDERKKIFLKEFNNKFRFLKVDGFVWVSAQQKWGLRQIWEHIDKAIEERTTEISTLQLRKLFNFLMKQRPPNKLRNKKRAVIYDLLYTSSKPPTFELLVRDKTAVHWSYMRFLENILRKNFDFSNNEIRVRAVDIDKRKLVS